MHVKIISHPSGDQLPMLVDGDGMPIPLPNEFIMGRRALSPNTLIRNLRELSVLFKWLESENIDLMQRIRSSQRFSEAHIVGGMVETLARDQETRRNIRKIGISPHTFNQRLTTVRQFLSWCFDIEMGIMPRSEYAYEQIRDHKNMVCTWLNNAFKSSPPTNRSISKGLNQQEISFLMACLDPLLNDIGRDRAVLFRNYISTMIMLSYGLRPGELLSLHVEDIEIGAISSVRVERREPNSNDNRRPRPQIKRNGRILPIENTKFAHQIDEYIMYWRDVLAKNSNKDSDFLILSDEGDPLSQSTLTQLYQRLRRRFPEHLPRHLTAKTLRHTFSSRMEKSLRQAGVDEDRRRQVLAYQRGDSSLKSQDIYIQQEIDEQAALALKQYQAALFEDKL